MRDFGRLYKDDTGTSVMVEYILAIIIMSVLFSMVVILMNSMVNNTDKIVLEQELGVVAHDISNRISIFSQTFSANQYQTDYLISDATDYSETIDLPDLVGGKPYSLDITYDPGTGTGTVKAFYSQNPNIYRSVSFASAYEVEPTTFSSTSASLRISYDRGIDKIKVGC